MKKKIEQKKVNKPLKIFLGIVGGIFALLFVMIIFAIAFGGDSGQEYTLNNIDNSEVMYLYEIETYLELFIKNNEITSDLAIGISHGTISLSDGVVLFELGRNNYEAIENSLNEMNVPTKYLSVHSHFTNAVKYMKEASELAKQGCLYDNANLIEQATTKIYQSANELQKCNAILESLN